MDVKDVRASDNNQELLNVAADNTLQKPVKELTQAVVDSALAGVDSQESVEVNLKSNGKSDRRTDSSVKLNTVISVVNVAAEASNEIGKLVNSLGGILEQAGQDLSDNRRVALEDEANQLVQAIRNKAQSSSPDGVKPLAGDKVRIEIENTLGKALEVILPEDAKDAFGLGQIHLSRKEVIVQTQTTVAIARERIDKIRASVESARTEVEATALELDVAAQNAEASQSSVRDVNEALALADKTRLGIGKNPEGALGSLSKLATSAKELLE